MRALVDGGRCETISLLLERNVIPIGAVDPTRVRLPISPAIFTASTDLTKYELMSSLITNLFYLKSSVYRIFLESFESA